MAKGGGLWLRISLMFLDPGFDCFSHPRVLYFVDNFYPMVYVFGPRVSIAFTPGYLIIGNFYPGYMFFGPRVLIAFHTPG